MNTYVKLRICLGLAFLHIFSGTVTFIFFISEKGDTAKTTSPATHRGGCGARVSTAVMLHDGGNVKNIRWGANEKERRNNDNADNPLYLSLLCVLRVAACCCTNIVSQQ